MGPSAWGVEDLVGSYVDSLHLGILFDWQAWGCRAFSDDVSPDWFDVCAGRREDSGETVAVLLLAFSNVTFDECQIRSRIFLKVG